MDFDLVLQKAVVDLNNKKETYNEVCPEFEDVAYLEMKAAEARLRAVVKEIKKGGNLN